jgi:DNA mismatch repair protein MSH5
MNGISEHIVERACELAQLSSRGEDLVSHCSVLSKDDAVELESAESAAELFMGQDFEREMTRDELLGMLDAMLERSAEEMEELSM